MDARVRNIRDLFQSNEQYVIPFFQRSYAWKKKERELLWEDIQRLVAISDVKSTHFLGPVVCSSVDHVPGGTKPYLLIDGQQRLTTLTIFLIAIRDAAKEIGEDGLAEQIHEDILINKRQTGAEYFKLLPRYHDAGVLKALINNQDAKPFRDHEIYKAWRFAKRWINENENNQEEYLRNLFVIISERLTLVVISIENEDPYEIFEGLNNRGIPLQESDLIRNFVFMKVEFEKQEEFNEIYWQPFEDLFSDAKKTAPKLQTIFFRHYLMMDGEYSHQKATFSDFRRRVIASNITLEEQMKEIQQLAKIDRIIRNPEEIEELTIRRLVEEVHALDIVDSARSLLLSLLNEWQTNTISLDELEICLKDFTSFVIRRSLCSMPTRRYDRWFPNAIKQIKDDPTTNLKDYWLSRGWPSDENVRDAITKSEIYKSNPRLAHLLLKRIEESYAHKEKIELGKLTIEHVMPQKLNESWEQMLGENWFEKHQQWIHTIGNLTLTGYNSELGNSEFLTKRDSYLKSSNLQINKYFLDHNSWTPIQIRDRAGVLGEQITRLWRRPEYDGPEIDHLGTKDQTTTAAANVIREFSINRIQRFLELELFEKSTARFADKSDNTTVVCLASRAYKENKIEGFWFGFNPNQRTILRDYKNAYVALCCGSPETVLVIPFNRFDPHVDELNTTEDENDSTQPRHWHILIRSREGSYEMQLPKKDSFVDLTEFLI